MHNMGVTLTDEQRARLLNLKETMGFRSASATIGWLINLEWESRTAYKERKLNTEHVEPQKLEPETV